MTQQKISKTWTMRRVNNLMAEKRKKWKIVHLRTTGLGTYLVYRNKK